ncbi:DUF222 domain-containing protein [Actinopolymorpha sp. B9G3]|uniref:DUF222 domain-containing protein n=1 Tax=Actinopolymorpha sp. B9G3 TaxID=3158970 RepID=UPI0032D9196F
MFDRRGDPDFSVLASAAPGPELGAVLAGIDTAAVNGHVRVLVMAAWERQVSWASARLYEVMAHVARSPACEPDSPPELDRCFGEFASAEVGAALCMSPGSADRELSFAFELTERLPLTRAALTAGRISVGKARSIADETSWLAPELAGVAEAFILAADAGASGLTRAQLVRRLRRKVCELDPDGVEARRKEAQQGRRVRFGAGVDGTGTIEGRDLPLAGTAAARVFIKAAAKRIRAGGDVRTLAQIEADVYLDLLRGRHPATAERDDDTATPTGSDIPAQGEGPPATGNAAPSTSGGDEAADPTGNPPLCDDPAPGGDAGGAGGWGGLGRDTEVDLDDPGDGGDRVEAGDEQLVGRIELVADLQTWLGLESRAGELAGFGAVTPR